MAPSLRILRKVARTSARKWHVLEPLFSHPDASSFEAPLIQVIPPSPTSIQQIVQSPGSSTSSHQRGPLELRNPDAISSSTGSQSSQSSRHRSAEEILGAGDIDVDSFELEVSDEEEDAAAAEEEHTNTIEVQPKAPHQAAPRRGLYPYHGAYPANLDGTIFVPLTRSLKHKHGMTNLKDNLGNSIQDSPNGQAEHRQIQLRGDQHEASGNGISHPDPLRSLPSDVFVVGCYLSTPSTHPQHHFNFHVIPAALFDGRPSRVHPSDPYINKALPPMPSPHPSILQPGHSAVETPLVYSHKSGGEVSLHNHSYEYMQLRWRTFVYLRELHYEQMRVENARRDEEEAGYYYTRLTGALEDLGEFEFDAWKFELTF